MFRTSTVRCRSDTKRCAVGSHLALGGIVGNVGANLIANQVQHWKDEADAAEQLSQAAQSDPAVREALDVLLDKLDVIGQAQVGMSDQDRALFLEMLRREVARLGSSLTVITVTGYGAAAVGERVAAAGAGGVAVVGDIQGDLIAPGATKVVGPPSVAEQQKEEALAHYLHNLRRLCNALPLAALAEEESPHRQAAITLNRVYIALNTTAEASLLEEQAYLLREGLLHILRAQPLPALEVADQEARLVVLGDSGSGKSTFVNYLAYLLAGAWLGEEEVPGGWSHGAMLPIRVTLRELAGHLPKAGELQKVSAEKRMARLVGVVWKYLRQELEATYRAGKALEILEREVDQGRALVIFDGLDEVAPERQGVVREAVEAFCQQCDEKSRVLVTCRLRSYREEVRLSTFADITLAPFAIEQIDDFIERWYRALADLGTLKPQEARRRAENLQAVVRPLLELASNPLLLTTMAVVHTAQVELPEERARLYQRCVDVLLRRWHKHKAGEVSLLDQLGVSESKLLPALWEVAYQAHQRAGAKEEKDLLHSEVLRVLAGHLEGKYGPAEQFLEHVDAQAGLLVGQGGIRESVYTFPHQTFQEYLAGCHLALGGRDFGRRLRELLGEGNRWALAAQLGAEHLLYNVVDEIRVLDAAYTLCPVAEPEGEADWRGVLWAGFFAAEMGRRRVKEDTEAQDGGVAFLERLVSRLVKILEEEWLGPIERAAAGNVLAQLGDPRFREDAFWLPDEPLLGLVEIPAGPFLMGTQKEDIPTLLEKFSGEREWYKEETPQHQLELPAFYIARYPVTHAQYAVFVRETGHKPPTAEEDWERSYEWRAGRYPPQRANQPVVLVTYYDALEYCRWLTEKLRVWPGAPRPLARLLRDENWIVTLPSEAQWEKAARGGLSSPSEGKGLEVRVCIFPWGNDFDAAKCNVEDTGIGTTSAVGIFPGGASSYGVLDLSGNVWEWTRSLWGEVLFRSSFKYPYDPGDGREDLDASNSVRRVLRGGAFSNIRGCARCAFRYRYSPDGRHGNRGFRVCVVSQQD